MKISLVIGGANSGKTSFSLDLLNRNSNKYYLATAQLLDDEIKQKVKDHQLERQGMDIKTIENHGSLEKVWTSVESDAVILMDCLTTWMTNHIYNKIEKIDFKDIENYLASNFDIRKMNFKELIIVTNEINLGGVRMDVTSRKSCKILAQTNRYIARICDEAWFVLCGIPKKWK